MPRLRAECASSLSGVQHQLATKHDDDKTPDFERRDVRSAWKDCTELEKEGAMSLAISENGTTIRSSIAMMTIHSSLVSDGRPESGYN